MQQALLVSVARTVVGVTLTLSITTIGAFCLSRKMLPGRRTFLLIILVTILVGGGLIPTYLLYRNLGLVNTFWVYIIPGLVDSWGLLVIKQFMEQQPLELEEAALMDGAGYMQILARVVVPLSTPVLAAIGLFEAVGAWNSWTDSLIYVANGKLWSFQYVLRNMLQGVLVGFLNMNQQLDTASMDLATKTSAEALKMAAVIIGTVPILCVYPFLQKYFTKGMLTGSIKG
jgi:putative aldouronate transport system permease protein